MAAQSELRALLASCTLRLDTNRGPQGTAFFVAPGYAVTAAHITGGSAGNPVRLHSRAATWEGLVEDVRPAMPAAEIRGLYPAPDLALIRIRSRDPHQ